MTRPATLALGISVLLALMSATLAPTSQAQALPDGWRTFEGSWSAVGHRQTVPTEQGRDAAVVQLSGAVVLTDPAGPSAGFLGEAIAFDDGGNLSTGRAVWTDARGDRLFSTLRGDPLHTGRRIAGTITGGTGRYAGFTGDYALTWQYIVSADDNVVQGRTVDLRGRFRAGESRR